MNQILLGNCLEVLRTLEDNSADAVITDPPYGLGNKEPTLDEIVSYLCGLSELDTGGDFKGADWFIPSVSVWRECYRVLKPGGHLLSFGGTKTQDLISMGLRAAGFNSRDTIASQLGVQVLQWLQGQGFPRGNTLKPSWEPILVFRKPLEGSVSENVDKYGTGAYNIEDTRVGSRWPANVIFTHTEECVQVGVEKVKAPVINRFDDGMKPFGGGAGHAYTSHQRGDSEGMEEVPIYECVDGCPVKALVSQNKNAPKFFCQFKYEKKANKKERGEGNTHPTVKPLELMKWLIRLVSPEKVFVCPHCNEKEKMSGVQKSGMGAEASDGIQERIRSGASVGGARESRETPHLPRSSASLKWVEDGQQARKLGTYAKEGTRQITEERSETSDLSSLSRQNKGERECKSCGCSMIIVPATILDPYCGSGTTCLAALETGRQFIGIEKDPSFHGLAMKRCLITL